MQSQKSQTIGNCEGFDTFAGKRWIYPNNMPIRSYQMNAVQKALFTNSMIVLPTGFGKTFIAAVVMYNFFRWYPEGKIIFVAPTRPLVSQQIEECKKISGIPSSDCIEITGLTNSAKRAFHWQDKRVFFATPQVIENDLRENILPARKVKCIVIDEAHRAQGDYAYVGIVRRLHELNPNGFRVLALSATPGYDITRVQQVMLNLYIGDVMFRSEDSIDLMQYKNSKMSRAWTVELTGKHKKMVEIFIEITRPTYKELYRAGLTYSQDSIDKVSRGLILMAGNRITQNDFNQSSANKGKLRFLTSLALSLRYYFDLLTLYGLRVFYSSIMKKMQEPRNLIKTAMIGIIQFDIMMNEIEQIFGDDIEPDPSKDAKVDLTLGHPKLSVVKDLLLKHFKENEDKTETRVIVFTKYRESVNDIVQMLRAFNPVVRAGAFVGQQKAGAQGGMKQTEQIAIVKEFKQGKYNVLVATSVAEEGLDIGEVDLILCYDTTASPISSTQRRGRTGRKRSGNVQTLLTKNYEEDKMKKASNSRRQVETQLFNRENYMSSRYDQSPRLVPADILPVCLEQKITPVNDDESNKDEKPKRKRRKAVETPVSSGKKVKKEFPEE